MILRITVTCRGAGRCEGRDAGVSASLGDSTSVLLGRFHITGVEL